MKKSCFGNRPFPDRDGEEACKKCKDCLQIEGCSAETIGRLFPEVHVIG